MNLNLMRNSIVLNRQILNTFLKEKENSVRDLKVGRMIVLIIIK